MAILFFCTSLNYLSTRVFESIPTNLYVSVRVCIYILFGKFTIEYRFVWCDDHIYMYMTIVVADARPVPKINLISLNVAETGHCQIYSNGFATGYNNKPTNVKRLNNRNETKKHIADQNKHAFCITSCWDLEKKIDVADGWSTMLEHSDSFLFFLHEILDAINWSGV